MGTMLKKSAKYTAKGVSSGLKYRFRKNQNIHQSPTFMIYQMTNNCNSRCMMCNIWKKESKGEMSAKELKENINKKMFQKLRWINLTGGEPFVRDDILEIVRVLNTLPMLEGIAIPTNGYLTDRIVKNIKEILSFLTKNRFLSVTLSIDGFEKTHDKIRGVSGAYKKVTKTLKELKKIKTKYPNFNVGVQPTISKLNLDEALDFYKYMKKQAGSVGFAVMVTSEGYYSNEESSIALSKKDKVKVAKILRIAAKNDPQYAFYYSKLIRLFKTGEREFGCLAGYLTFFMDPYGNISPCPVLSCNNKYKFGNVTEGDVWFTKNASRIKKDLKNEEICDSCSMMCDFISFAKVEFIEHSAWMLQHPKTLARLLKKIKSEKNPYF